MNSGGFSETLTINLLKFVKSVHLTLNRIPGLIFEIKALSNFFKLFRIFKTKSISLNRLVSNLNDLFKVSPIK